MIGRMAASVKVKVATYNCPTRPATRRGRTTQGGAAISWLIQARGAQGLLWGSRTIRLRRGPGCRRQKDSGGGEARRDVYFAGWIHSSLSDVPIRRLVLSS